MTDTSTQNQKRVLGEAPRQAPITYQTGLDSGFGGGHSGFGGGQ